MSCMSSRSESKQERKSVSSVNLVVGNHLSVRSFFPSLLGYDLPTHTLFDYLSSRSHAVHHPFERKHHDRRPETDRYEPRRSALSVDSGTSGEQTISSISYQKLALTSRPRRILLCSPELYARILTQKMNTTIKSFGLLCNGVDSLDKTKQTKISISTRQYIARVRICRKVSVNSLVWLERSFDGAK